MAASRLDRCVTTLVSSALQFTHDGKHVAMLAGAGVAIAGVDGPTRWIVVDGGRELAAFGDQLWTLGAGGLERWTLDGRSLGVPLPLDTGSLAPALTGAAAAVCGRRAWLDDFGALTELPLEGDAAFAFAGRRHATVAGNDIRLGATRWTLPVGARLAAAAALFDGACVAFVIERAAGRELWVATTAGALRHRITLPAGLLRLAARRGVLVVHDGQRFTAIDVRLGRTLGEAALPADDIAIDRDGRLLAVRTGDSLAILSLDGALRARTEPVAEPIADPAISPAPGLPTPPPPAPPAPAPVLERPLALRALEPRAHHEPLSLAHARAQLDRELALVARWAFVAIAVGWDTRRLGYGNESAHPHEHEVAAILGMNGGFAREHLAAARAEANAHAAELAVDRARRGPATPLGALAGELELSPLAVDILLAAAAPALSGDVARLYGILANDPNRPLVDEHLLASLLPACSPHDIAHELDARAPLLRSGALQLAGDHPRPFAAIVVDPVIVARLRAEPPDLSSAVALRTTPPALEHLDLAPGVLPAALAALSAPIAGARIAVRGRPSTGRRTLLAALSAEANRALATIDAARLPRSPDAFAGALRTLLRRSYLAGFIPCITNLETISFGERTVNETVTEVVRAHPGPLAIVTAPDTALPFDPGHLEIDLPVLGETERLAVWQRQLAAANLWVGDPATLAARYRIGPGLIRRAIAAAGTITDDATPAIEAFIRQTRDARLATIAHRIERTATWASLILPPDVLDSLRELVGRVRHRRQVYETWGMGAALTTSRGITALFQGQPGTGKTLVAGVIARELGLDLYQVDLSKVMSKWIGETERNLATVFDAAEDGQAILLFDEADSLFAKRTEVRSSNDRYANLEVNYLLQRLDAFEGIAILTTNFGGSIDPAFKRRLSFRLSFPFPDEDTREQLWRVHLPPQLPLAGELALDKLARKYQLAGGYIRNACLRAAFLAAQEESALDQRHLERAVTLEFAELGKLSSSGSLE